MKKILQILTLLATMSVPGWAQSNQALYVNINSAKNFNDQQYEKLLQAKQLVEQIINSAAFKSRVLNFTFKHLERSSTTNYAQLQ